MVVAQMPPPTCQRTVLQRASTRGSHLRGWDVKTRQQRTQHRQSGAAAVEYAFLLVIGAMVLMGVLANVESSVGDLWSHAATQISTVLGSG
ncbi:hypothetical protein LMG18090_04706 [Ralstonia mannitolilytica]|nr:hypothetical protein LMG18090_04706 [Ralstonia mannitolilytica]